MSARYEAARVAQTFAGTWVRPGEVVPPKAIRALEATKNGKRTLRHLLDVGRLVLVVDDEPVAAASAAAAVNVRASRG